MKKQIVRVIDKALRTRGYGVYETRGLGLAYGEELLKRVIEFAEIDMVFDIGANSGQYARALRSGIGYQGPIVTIEPIPELSKRIRSLNDPLIHVYEVALADAPGTAQFNIMACNLLSSLLKPASAYEGKFGGTFSIVDVIEVRVETFYWVFNETKRRHAFKNALLKIDTQGTELAVLQGAGTLLAEIPAVQLEVSFDPIYQGAPHFGQVFDVIAQNGLSLSGIFPNNYGTFPRLLEMDAIFMRRDLFPRLH